MANSNDIGAPPTAPETWQSKRAKDFRIIGGAAIAVLLVLALTGHIWIDPFSGTVVKTDLNAADPAVRCAITVTYRKDEALDFWVPAQMDEYYKAALGLDEIISTSTYANVRRFLKPSAN